MQKKIIAIVALASTLIGGGALVATNALAQTPVPTAPHVRGRRVERHPEIRKAMRQLSNALNTMRHANDDFNGHKEAAMDDTQKALGELKAALKSDRR